MKKLAVWLLLLVVVILIVGIVIGRLTTDVTQARRLPVGTEVPEGHDAVCVCEGGNGWVDNNPTTGTGKVYCR